MQKLRSRDDSDLFIEPATDKGLVYGRMSDASGGSSPYIRLLGELRNSTRAAGGQAKLKCEAAGTPPLNFSWLKNHAPVEKSRRVRIRNRDYSSRLVISELEVLDSGHYKCVVSNAAASLNTSAVLKVVPASATSGGSSSTHRRVGGGGGGGRGGAAADGELVEDDYDDYDEMLPGGSNHHGRLPEDEDAQFAQSSSSRGGPGFAPLETNERWLDNVQMKEGECVPYAGEACARHLGGRRVLITTQDREAMYDLDRDVRGAILFMSRAEAISADCKRYFEAAACSHVFRVCGGSDGTRISMCRRDCEVIETELCAREMQMAVANNMVGDQPKALLPNCTQLPQNPLQCTSVLDSAPSSSNDYSGYETTATDDCYVGNGQDYRGRVSTSTHGLRCQPWRDAGIAEESNRCRNPDGRQSSPWCYVRDVDGGLSMQSCAVPRCASTTGGTTSSTPPSIRALWSQLGSQWQLALLGGGVVFGLLLILLFCCACCCRRKKSKAANHHHHHHHASDAKMESLLLSSNGAGGATLTLQSNGTLYRRLDMQGPPAVASSLMGGGAGNNATTNNCTPLLGRTTRGAAVHHPMMIPEQEVYEVPEISLAQLRLTESLGEGQFALVHTGIWTRSVADQRAVVIKSLRPDASMAERVAFQEELRAVALFEHPNVLRMLGVCFLEQGGVRIGAVYDFDVHGNLIDFLRVRQPRLSIDSGCIPELYELCRMTVQIAAAMEYLASRGHVHRDLAARNVLVADEPDRIRISDFYGWKAEYASDYCKMQHRVWMPIRWTAPEVLVSGRWSEASDVWSFGVLLWEMLTFGRRPYAEWADDEIVELVTSRRLLEQPHGCPPHLYALMVECWHEYPERRPRFSELRHRLENWTNSGALSGIGVLSASNRSKSSSQSGSASRLGGGGRAAATAALFRGGTNRVPMPQAHVGLSTGDDSGRLSGADGDHDSDRS